MLPRWISFFLSLLPCARQRCGIKREIRTDRFRTQTNASELKTQMRSLKMYKSALKTRENIFLLALKRH